MGRRILKEDCQLDKTYPFRQHYYYDGQSIVEIRDGSDYVLKQQVWGLRYVDELVQIAVNDDPPDTERAIATAPHLESTFQF